MPSLRRDRDRCRKDTLGKEPRFPSSISKSGPTDNLDFACAIGGTVILVQQRMEQTTDLCLLLTKLIKRMFVFIKFKGCLLGNLYCLIWEITINDERSVRFALLPARARQTKTPSVLIPTDRSQCLPVECGLYRSDNKLPKAIVSELGFEPPRAVLTAKERYFSEQNASLDDSPLHIKKKI